ncbi:MAG TPA: universal stress protein [Pseudonocardiaceae bacterium]
MSEHRDHPRADRVVAGVDGSDAATRAALWAADEAARHHLPLHLVHCYYQPYLYYPPLATSTTVNDALLSEAEHDLRAAVTVVRAARPDVEVRGALRYGHPVQGLLDEAATARMLVLGHRGRHGFDGLLVGSVAAAVPAHAPCPVAVVRDNGTPGTAPVVVGVDGSPVSEAAVAVAFDEAATRGVPLVAVHAWTGLLDEGLPIGLPEDPERVRQVVDEETRVLAERLAGWQEKYPDVGVERVVVRRRADLALLDRTATAQLLVVGSRGRGGFTGMLLGSTSRAVLNHATGTVIVARPVRA